MKIRQSSINEIEIVFRNDWEGDFIVTQGKIYKPADLSGFSAIENEKLMGLISFKIAKHICEITSLNSFAPKQGIGTKLVNAAINQARKENCLGIYLITTNDNTYALQFYQKLGFVIKSISNKMMKKSRKLKPNIPPKGHNSIPIIQEIRLWMPL
jgi:ribosomal protein S18 acetylase RimI-like enzyme